MAESTGSRSRTPIFDSFFRIQDTRRMVYPHDPGISKGRVSGHLRGQRPAKRLMVVINYNNDIGDYMEWSGQGW